MKAIDLANRILKAAAEGRIHKDAEVWFEYNDDVEEVKSAYIDTDGDVILTMLEEETKKLSNI